MAINWAELKRLIREAEDDASNTSEADRAINDAILHIGQALQSSRSSKLAGHMRSALQLLDQADQANTRLSERIRARRDWFQTLVREMRDDIDEPADEPPATEGG